jgi:hypothetical protein
MCGAGVCLAWDSEDALVREVGTSVHAAAAAPMRHCNAARHAPRLPVGLTTSMAIYIVQMRMVSPVETLSSRFEGDKL